MSRVFQYTFLLTFVWVVQIYSLGSYRHHKRQEPVKVNVIGYDTLEDKDSAKKTIKEIAKENNWDTSLGILVGDEAAQRKAAEHRRLKWIYFTTFMVAAIAMIAITYKISHNWLLAGLSIFIGPISALQADWSSD